MGVLRSSSVSSFKMHDAKRWPIVVSLDVHDSSTFLYVVDTRTGEVLRETRIDGHHRNVLRHLSRLGPKGQLSVILEAGPLGFAPWRCYTDAGYQTFIISPTSIPHRARQQKTDREDAVNNLRYHLSGLLRYVHVLDIEDEHARECLRERQQIVWQIIKQKQKLLALVKRQGLEFTLTKSNWTKKHWEWLRTVELSAVVRALVDVHLERVQWLAEQEKKLWKVVHEYLEAHTSHKVVREWYSKLAGVGPIVSATLILEGGDMNRFRHPVPLMKYTGLMPGKRQSGNADPTLHITKAGNKYLRTAIVSIAKYYQDPRAMYSAALIGRMPTVLGEFIKRCQDRLCGFYHSLRLRGKSSTKARVAVAREMCGFLWEFIVKIVPQLEHQQISLSV